MIGTYRKMKRFDVDKYLKKNPVSVSLPYGRYSTAVIIPAYDELNSIGSTLDSLNGALRKVSLDAAVIVVINYPPGADDFQSKKLLEEINSGKYGKVYSIYLPDNPGGVGAARKEGMDAFIHSIPPENMERSVICSLDADTIVDASYFIDTLPEVLKGGAVSIPFSHQEAESPARQRAIDDYEAYMTRYVQKLSDAGSPYAFYTIGSAFAVRCDAYIRAGGMKTRTAGEDFYFLQAVAKSSGVRQLSFQAVVHPSPRISKRVPFGTGPAMELLLKGGKLNVISDPAFDALQRFLHIAADLEALAEHSILRSRLEEKMRIFLDKEGFFDRFGKVAKDNRKQPEKLLKSFHEWFDGLKTLKFLHFFSD